eukprot:2197681-Amphidinium_carterae.1
MAGSLITNDCQDWKAKSIITIEGTRMGSHRSDAGQWRSKCALLSCWTGKRKEKQHVCCHAVGLPTCCSKPQRAV